MHAGFPVSPFLERHSPVFVSLLLKRDYTIPRVPESLSLRWNWDPPPPLPQMSVLPPGTKAWRGGGVHTRLRVRGWGSPNSDDWRESLVLTLLFGSSRPLSPASVSHSHPLGTKEGRHTCLRVRSRGGANSYDWRESLALCAYPVVFLWKDCFLHDIQYCTGLQTTGRC